MYPLIVTPHFLLPLSQAQATSNLFFVLDLPILDISYKRNYIVHSVCDQVNFDIVIVPGYTDTALDLYSKFHSILNLGRHHLKNKSFFLWEISNICKIKE